MDTWRLGIILIMGLMAFAVRVLPQIFFHGQRIPPAWDRFLRYLSYAFICSIIATTLFLAAGRFQSHAAPYRAAALIATIIVAQRTKSALAGMLSGAVLIAALSWLP
jgi:branched-subunit amino acid transport protein